MQQTIIKVGNSLAVTLPSSFVKTSKIKAGQKVSVQTDAGFGTMQVSTKNDAEQTLTPEFYTWLKKFNSKYKNALSELAKK